jgi:hypothetical protein
LPLGPAAAVSEAFGERVVDPVDDLDGERVVEDPAGA